MSGHRITAIIAFALCTSGAFASNDTAANEPFKCEENWPCNYSKMPGATFYSHTIKDYDSPSNMWPYTSQTRFGQTILHFASNSLDDPASDYQIKCSNGEWGDEHTVTSGAMVYVTGESRSYTMPDGWHYVSREEGKKRGWGSDEWHDWVAVNNEASRIPLFCDKDDCLFRYLEHEFPYWENNDIRWGAIWRCQDEEWWYYDNNPQDVDDLHSCDDGADALERQNNRENDWAAVKTLVPGNATDYDVAYHTVIASPGTRQPCLTYRCKSGYKATCKLGECYGERMSCAPVDRSCPMPDDQYMVTGQADVVDCSENYGYNAGTLYIGNLKHLMNESLTNNYAVATRLYEIEEAKGQDGNLPFTCNNGGCSLKDDVFNSQQCEFRCFDDGIRVRLAPKQTGNQYTIECPKYFKPVIDDNSTYTCVFDGGAAREALNRDAAQKQAAATAVTNACATAICRASGGEYRNGQCKCGEVDICTDDYNGYKYCGGNGTRNGTPLEGKYFCDDTGLGEGVPQTHLCYRTKRPRGTTAQACYLGLVQKAYNDTSACNTDNATDDASDPESISALAATLDAIEDAYGLSKWRTVDGKFNYARLASDATAAVVLGTTGALVTSSVVKKKQVEAGFESLECTVGGQHVGDWGDVFRIDGK